MSLEAGQGRCETVSIKYRLINAMNNSDSHFSWKQKTQKKKKTFSSALTFVKKSWQTRCANLVFVLDLNLQLWSLQITLTHVVQCGLSTPGGTNLSET